LFLNFFHLSSIQVSNALLQIIFFPIVIRIVGIAEFGYVSVFSSYAALGGMLINYGTGQTGIRDVAINRNNTQRLSDSFFSVFSLRIILFLGYILLNGILLIFDIPHIHFLTFAFTIVLAEVLNPLFFFVGTENLTLYNLLNIASKLLTIGLILLFVRHPQDAELVNFFVGATNCVIYLVLIAVAIKRNKLIYNGLSLRNIMPHFKSNSYLLGNNISVQLQQSFFLFMLGGAGNALILGAYSVADKVIWSARLLISSISNAVFPKGAIIFKESYSNWKNYKRRLTIATSCLTLTGTAILLFWPEIVVRILTGSETELPILYLRCMSVVPFLAALNVFNVSELLYKRENKQIFTIAFIVLIVSLLLTISLVSYGNPKLYGYYLPGVDFLALILFTYTIKKGRTSQSFDEPIVNRSSNYK